MANLIFQDEADEFRIEIVGKFSGTSITEVEQHWQKVLSDGRSRKITVDISRMHRYDAGGCKLLRTMYQHGTMVAAATPRSLVFLAEITAAQRKPAVPTPIRGINTEQGARPHAKAAGASE